jgi:hypothetical protein
MQVYGQSHAWLQGNGTGLMEVVALGSWLRAHLYHKCDICARQMLGQETDTLLGLKQVCFTGPKQQPAQHDTAQHSTAQHSEVLDVLQLQHGMLTLRLVMYAGVSKAVLFKFKAQGHIFP